MRWAIFWRVFVSRGEQKLHWKGPGVHCPMHRKSERSCKRPPRIESFFTRWKATTEEVNLAGGPWRTRKAHYEGEVLPKDTSTSHVLGPQSTESSSRGSTVLSPHLSAFLLSFRSNGEGVRKVGIRRGELLCQASFPTMDFQPEADSRREDSTLNQPLDHYMELDMFITKVRRSLWLKLTPGLFYYPGASRKATVPARVFIMLTRL